jgi:hypothetical protein
MIGDSESFVIEERVVLSKFEGDARPENEIERVHIVNGEVVLLEKIENGEVVSSETVKEA